MSPGGVGTVIGTAVGTTLVFMAAKSSLGEPLRRCIGVFVAYGGDMSPAELLTPRIIGDLVGLAILSLLPVVYKRLWTRKG